MTYQGDARHTAASGGDYDRIRRRAYEIYQSRGGQHGADFDDWLAAERELAQRGQPSALTEPAALTARVDADAGVLGASAPGDVTTDGAPTGKANGQPSATPASPASPASPRKAAAKTAPAKTATTGTAAKAAPAKGASSSKAAASQKPAPTKGVAKAAPEASAPAKKPAPRRKTTPRDQPEA